MLANLLFDIQNIEHLFRNPLFWIAFLFQVWMLVDAIRRREIIWAVFIFLFSVFSAILYYFLVYRQSPSLSTAGFELPGAHQRQRIRELEGQIHHLDKAYHHAQLGDVYFQQGKLDRAEACYRAAMERDAEDPDIRAHLGQCLLRQGKPDEALPLLQEVCRGDPKHDYGHSMMALAESLTALDQVDDAIQVWRHVNENHSYARARVQLAELYATRRQHDEARALLREVLEDAPHTPAFQRKRDRPWVRRAKSLSQRMPA